MSNQTQTKENAAKWSGSLGFIMAEWEICGDFLCW